MLKDSYVAGRCNKEYVIKKLLAASEEHFVMFPSDLGDAYQIQADLDFHELASFMGNPKKYRLRARLSQRFPDSLG